MNIISKMLNELVDETEKKYSQTSRMTMEELENEYEKELESLQEDNQ